VTPNNRIALYYEHASNGFLAYPNPGMDNIGLRLATASEAVDRAG
jgi:hypothetical protein